MWNELKDPSTVYHHLHGKNDEPTLTSQLAGQRKWMKGYTSKRCATVNEEDMVKVYYDRCCQKPTIKFVVGTPVDRLLYGAFLSVNRVVLEEGRELQAQKTILATGHGQVVLSSSTNKRTQTLLALRTSHFSRRIREIPSHCLPNKPYYRCQRLYPSRRLREDPPQNDRSS